MKHHLVLAVFLAAGALWPHPMGRFSVSHYGRIEVSPRGAEIRYVLDLAEVPTAQLLEQWKLAAAAPREELERRAAAQARQWAGGLKIAIDGRAVTPRFEDTSMVLDKGADGMPVMRVTADLTLEGAPGGLTYEDANFPDRAGWKEIVIRAGQDAAIDQASPQGADRSQELTAYPRDALAAPPQDLRATVAWHSTALAPAAGQPPALPGMAVRGDYLSRLLHQGEIGWGMLLAGLAVAFGLGAIHALSPGHGKTIVAAYLVGSRGTPRHALFLGGTVTFTHTISVFFLGFTTLFLSRYVLPERIYPVLGVISGLSIVWIGGALFYQRMRLAMGLGHGHQHHGPFAHDHGDGHVHSHVPEGDVSMGSLIALGASGGLVPCPSALVLLLSSVALGRVGLGLTLLVAFSAGLAVVLSAIGMVVLYAKHLLPDARKTAASTAFRYLPVASAAVIVCAGVIMTAVALGLIRPFAGV